LLATPATVSSPYTHTLIQEHAPNITVSLYSSVELVTLAEQLFFSETLDIAKFKKELNYLQINKEIDVLVLGCTHFPILADPISKYFNKKLYLFDSGAAIANRVNYLLNQHRRISYNASDTKKPLQYYATADVCSNKLAVKRVTLIDPTQYVKS
jgi:glutamate racemase